VKTFKEFLLDDKNIAEQSIYLPAGADIVNVSMTDAGLMLLAIVKPAGYETELPENRIFKICETGEIFLANTVKYIGSFTNTLGIKHVIEIKREF
jgi:hypothetical protein